MIEWPCWEAVEGGRWDLHGRIISWVLYFALSPACIPCLCFLSTMGWTCCSSQPSPSWYTNPLKSLLLWLVGTWSQWRERQVTQLVLWPEAGGASRIACLVCWALWGALSWSIIALLLAPPPAAPAPHQPQPSWSLPRCFYCFCLGKTNSSLPHLAKEKLSWFKLYSYEKENIIKTTHRHIACLHHLDIKLLLT